MNSIKTMTISQLVAAAHEASRSKGWYDGEHAVRNVPEMLCLIHSEVSEALEAHRDNLPASFLGPSGKPEGMAAELADVAIRVFDLCGYLGIDLEAAIGQKMAYNATRPHRHGGKVC